jgi:hypothetical protein
MITAATTISVLLSTSLARNRLSTLRLHSDDSNSKLEPNNMLQSHGITEDQIIHVNNFLENNGIM